MTLEMEEVDRWFNLAKATYKGDNKAYLYLPAKDVMHYMDRLFIFLMKEEELHRQIDDGQFS